jgi:hypothetical protein
MERRFTLFDVMILVAATAAGFALMRPLAGAAFAHQVMRNYGLAWSALVRASWVILAMTPLLAVWSLALLVLRLRQPRPRFRRLLRQPGFVASISVVFGSLISLIILLLCSIKVGRSELADAVLFITYPVGYAPANGWLLLMISGKWRNEKSWIDLTGRVLGVCWISVIFSVMVIAIDA